MIASPHQNDVLLGCGKFSNEHPGNIQFRQWIHERIDRHCQSADKNSVCQEVVDLVRQQVPPGRLLRPRENQSGWEEVVGDEALLAKVKRRIINTMKMAENRLNPQTLYSRKNPLDQNLDHFETRQLQLHPETQHTISGGSQEEPVVLLDDDSDSEISEKPPPFAPQGQITPEKHSLFSPVPAIASPTFLDGELNGEPLYEKPLCNSYQEGFATHFGGAVSQNSPFQPPFKRQRVEYHSNQTSPSTHETPSPYANLLFSLHKSDVDIFCQDSPSPIPAHKVILAKSSCVLKALWLTNPSCDSLTFPFPMVVVKQVLTHLYTRKDVGRIILINHLPQFLAFTKMFQWMDLYRFVFRQAYMTISMNNLEDLLQTGTDPLKEVCRAFLQNHAVAVLTCPKITPLTARNPELWKEIVAAAMGPKSEYALLCEN